MSNLATYDLARIKADPNKLYGMGDFLLPEMAEKFGYQLPDVPTVQTLNELIAAVAPEKELQKNIEFAMRILGPGALSRVIDWVERSGAMQPIAGSFVNPGNAGLPKHIDLMTWSGAVANWQLRRLTQALTVDPTWVQQVILPIGIRQMGDDEHESVRGFTQRFGPERRLTEYRFSSWKILPHLFDAGFDPQLLAVNSANGDRIWDALFQANKYLIDGSVANAKILVIGNAPNTVQAAAQARAAARRVNPAFDRNGDQLYMYGDTFPVAHHGEPKETHQNPWSAIGQVLRLYMLLLEEALAG